MKTKTAMINNIDKLIHLLDSSFSVFHVVKNIEDELTAHNFIKIDETENFNLIKGKNYYVKRNDSSIIAFKIPNKIKKELSFRITATHNDSPTFKLKPHPVKKVGNLLQLDTEPYGGGIYNTFFDKPLSFAGRVFYSEEGKLKSKLVNVDKDLLIIPNVAIHMNRDVNTSNNINPAIDTLPLFASVKIDDNSFDFDKYLLNLLKCKNGTLLSHDLFLYNRERAKFIGLNDEFIASSKEDDLSSTYSSLLGFLNSHDENSISVYSSFDNEEVGSLTRQGAMSTFLKDILTRVVLTLGFKYEDYFKFVANSFVLSIDNAHASHPSHMELSNKPIYLNEGIVIKYNANAHYTSDGLSSSYIKLLCNENKIPYQEFTNRSDMRGGSTLGNLLQSQISVNMVDIGLPQLAMHSAYETLGRNDIEQMINLVTCFFNNNL